MDPIGEGKGREGEKGVEGAEAGAGGRSGTGSETGAGARRVRRWVCRQHGTKLLIKR